MTQDYKSQMQSTERINNTLNSSEAQYFSYSIDGISILGNHNNEMLNSEKIMISDDEIRPFHILNKIKCLWKICDGRQWLLRHCPRVIDKPFWTGTYYLMCIAPSRTQRKINVCLYPYIPSTWILMFQPQKWLQFIVHSFHRIIRQIPLSSNSIHPSHSLVWWRRIDHIRD